ncbi:HvfC family RiPP maturation protein [Shewanella aestuarii]|uniref:DUF2063 domain-containing protein n=1 Tax=Shewanella aestuarii TaxID=1028752 RepID=A0A6G9QLD2_9GAMM|nr:putative DNA-binding domain-containing protein [Shewanella aestuarii]QIR14857.1 DUF2063 domain-containing protein [Shewanella aestuarii]
MEFKQVQQGFMDYIRDPSHPLPEGIEPRRMTIYRELFFNNVNGFVSSAFPVLKSVYAEQDWLALVQTFFAQHDCQTPIFVEIAGEFLVFLQQEYQVKDSDPAFLLELAHYEWLELIVATVQDAKTQTLMTINDITQVPLQLSACAKVAQYQFDVQHISIEYQPIEPPATPQFFCVYRDTQDEVAFLQLNPLTAQVLALIDQYTQQQQRLYFDDIVSWLTQLYPTMQSDVLSQGCVQMLTQMVEKNIIVKPLS